MKIGELRALRLEKRLTQAEVAARWGVSQGYYSLVETGTKPREVGEAAAIVKAMPRRRDRTGGGAMKAGRSKRRET